MSPSKHEQPAALADQQRAFAAAVRLSAEPGALLRPRTGGAAPLLSTYRHAYVERLVQALRDNHDVLALALGDEAFAALARRYVAAAPSPHRSIRWYGDGLADFCGRLADAGDPMVPHPAHADVARMDWALRTAFDAADAAPLSAEDLMAVAAEDWPALRFALHPSTALVHVDWAIEAAWRALRDHAADPSGREPELPVPELRPHELLVWRSGLETRWRSLDHHEARAIRAVHAGQPFGHWCSHAQDDAATAASAAALWLRGWLDQGLLSGMRVDP
jgi:Putative DNA-binding domain